MDLIHVLQEVWALRALIASSLVGIMCGTLGAFIVLRNMSLIGDALSHAILPGVVVAFMLVGYSSLGFFVGAVIAGLISAVGITWIQRKIQTKNYAAIGIVFTAMFSIGVIGISRISKSGSGVHLDLKDFLFGNVLTVSDSDVLLTAAITLFVFISIIVLYRPLFLTTFQSVIAQTMGVSVSLIHYFLMLMLSFAVVASLQTVGVILVVAMLITPASTALLLSSRLKTVLMLSALIGWIVAVGGFCLAVLFDTTPGPAMAVTATAIYLVAAFVAPRKGLIAKWFARRKQQQRVEFEDILKQSLKLHVNNALTEQTLASSIGFSASKMKRYLARLSKAGYISQDGDILQLQSKGLERATGLIRAHRLWETYLAQQVGLTAEQIHDDAEHYEHLLTAELLDAVDEELGYPSEDPHGSPIPERDDGRKG
jgi:ABC-type Mn2+/Zn2+ transport system permease subunit/Mn-dependent DtxR family transcriptional regulator